MENVIGLHGLTPGSLIRIGDMADIKREAGAIRNPSVIKESITPSRSISVIGNKAMIRDNRKNKRIISFLDMVYPLLKKNHQVRINKAVIYFFSITP